MDLVVDTYRATEHFPSSERYGLTGQMRRAALSVPANIAKGNSRCSRPAYLNHVNVALGSTGELRTLLEIASRLGYLTPPLTADLSTRIDEVGRLLYGLRKALLP